MLVSVGRQESPRCGSCLGLGLGGLDYNTAQTNNDLLLALL